MNKKILRYWFQIKFALKEKLMRNYNKMKEKEEFKIKRKKSNRIQRKNKKNLIKRYLLFHSN